MRLSGMPRATRRRSCLHLLFLASLGSLVRAEVLLFRIPDNPSRSDLQPHDDVSYGGPPVNPLLQRLELDCSDPGSDVSLDIDLEVLAKGSSERQDLSEDPDRPLIDDGTDDLRRPTGVSPIVSRASHVVKREGEACPEVLSGLARGRWVPKSDVSESSRLDQYLRQVRGELRIPASLQRNDGRCGDVAYDGVSQYYHMNIRAVCNPVGPTPCCDNFRCRGVTTADCACPSCIDSRTPVHAELSDWLPANRACVLRELNTSQACAVLRGTSLLLAGDSYLRHVYVALLLLLTGNFQNGALTTDAPSYIQSACQGMFQINGLTCPEYLSYERTLCDGSVNVSYLEFFNSANGNSVEPWVRNATSRGEKVLLVTGLGIHEGFKQDLLWRNFLHPVVDYFRSATGDNRPQPVDDGPGTTPLPAMTARRLWPKLVWANTHAPGLLKSPRFPEQSFKGVKAYNGEIARLLGPYGVPILDSFHFTAALHSTDGTHYGYGANMLKVQILLNWVMERQERGEW